MDGEWEIMVLCLILFMEMVVSPVIRQPGISVLAIPGPDLIMGSTISGGIIHTGVLVTDILHGIVQPSSLINSTDTQWLCTEKGPAEALILITMRFKTSEAGNQLLPVKDPEVANQDGWLQKDLQTIIREDGNKTLR